MTRIIAGRAKGHRLEVPAHGTRPTADRVREAVFSSLDSWLLQEELTWADISVVDLFAGSGALGFEAWSRGAQTVTLVDSASRACATMQANKTQLGAADVVIACQPVDRWLRNATAPVDLCFLDPPYDMSAEQLELITSTLRAGIMQTAHALVVVERDVRSPEPFSAGLYEVRERTYGDTRIWYGHVVAATRES